MPLLLSSSLPFASGPPQPLKLLPNESAVAVFVLSSPVAAVAYLPAAIEAFTPKVAYVWEAATPRVGGCNPTCGRLQPRVWEAAP